MIKLFTMLKDDFAFCVHKIYSYFKFDVFITRRAKSEHSWPSWQDLCLLASWSPLVSILGFAEIKICMIIMGYLWIEQDQFPFQSPQPNVQYNRQLKRLRQILPECFAQFLLSNTPFFASFRPLWGQNSVARSHFVASPDLQFLELGRIKNGVLLSYPQR